MKKNGAKPGVEYTCVVDLVGGAGCLDEVEALIRSMPVKADTTIWETAWKIHKNTDMAKRIAEEILKLDPHDSASYVLLSHIHASAKSWHAVSAVWIAMRNIKNQVWSWLEIKNQVKLEVEVAVAGIFYKNGNYVRKKEIGVQARGKGSVVGLDASMTHWFI